MSKRLDNLIEREGKFHELDFGFGSYTRPVGPEMTKSNFISYNPQSGFYDYCFDVHKPKEFMELKKRMSDLGEDLSGMNKKEIEKLSGVIRKYNSFFETDDYRDIKAPYSAINFALDAQLDLSVESSRVYLLSGGDAVIFRDNLEETEFENINVHRLSNIKEVINFGVKRGDLANRRKDYYLSAVGLRNLSPGEDSPVFNNPFFGRMLWNNFAGDICKEKERLEKEHNKLHPKFKSPGWDDVENPSSRNELRETAAKHPARKDNMDKIGKIGKWI